MSWKKLLLCGVAMSSLAACASPESIVLKPYTLANGVTYQDVVSIGANGKGNAPVVTQVKTFALQGQGATLVTEASGYEPGLLSSVTSAAAYGAGAAGVAGAARHSTRVIVNSGSSAPTFGSDRRLKRDIAEVGSLTNGLKLYRFRYLWSDQVYVGVMAQDVLAVTPEAVITSENGYMQVDYAMLGISMLRWEQWQMTRRLGVFPTDGFAPGAELIAA